MSQYRSWRLKDGAPIVSPWELVNQVPQTNYIVCTSGGYDPIHPGHISCMLRAKDWNYILAVIVNGDAFLRSKKGKPFQDLKTRCQIVSAIRGVDFVVPYEVEHDMTVCGALDQIRPGVFVKGGDRVDASTIPEWDICKKRKIRVVTGIGLPKDWSSSDFLKDWENHSGR